MRPLGRLLLWVLGLGVAGLAGLILLAVLAPEPPSAEAQWQSLNPAERAAVDQLLQHAGLETAAVRPIFDASGRLFDHAANRRAIVIEAGHVTGLSLQGAALAELPETLGALQRLRALSLADNRLTAWPDLSALAELAFLDLSRNPALPSPDADRLPPGLTTLRLAETAVSDLRALSTLTRLKVLDLSATPVTAFDALLPLSLDTLDLSRTAVATLPAALPTTGDWQVDLSAAPAINPPGYAAAWPFEGLVHGASREADLPRGQIGAEALDVAGTIAVQQATLSYALPQTRTPVDGDVLLQASLAQGRARLWLLEPTGLFASPWLTRGLVSGFGAWRQPGHVHAELAAGQTVQLRGRLHHRVRDGIYDLPAEQRNTPSRAITWHLYSFYVEPVGGSLQGLRYRIRRADR